MSLPARQFTSDTTRPRPNEVTCRFQGPAGAIEAVVSTPSSSARRSAAVAVVCHPHPLHGGSLHNKVTRTLAHAACEQGATAVRFNFRGAGASEGRHDHGRGETEDLLTVIRQMRARHPDCELWLAGFSFGAYVALNAAQETAVERLVTVAPPVHLYDFTVLAAPTCPWLLIQGADDEVVPCKDVVKWASRLYPGPEGIYLDGVGHHFHGKLAHLQALLRDHLAAPLSPTRRLYFPRSLSDLTFGNGHPHGFET